MFIEEIEGNQTKAGPVMSQPTKRAVFAREDPYLDLTKNHIEPFNILIVSAGKNL